jgi:hemoglobin-like flavoprotein
MWTLGRGLGDEFTPDTRSAWAKVYGALAGAMPSCGRPNSAARQS